MSAGEQATDQHKRTAYAAFLIVVLFAAAALWVVEGDDAFRRVAVPVVVVVSATLLLAVLTRRLLLQHVERLLFLTIVVGIFSRLVLWRLTPDMDGIANVAPSMLWTVLILPLSFLTFGTRRGLRVCGVIYAMFVVLVVPPAVNDLLAGDGTDLVAKLAINLAVVYAIAIALLWVLASRLEHIAAAHTRGNLLESQAHTDTLTGIANRRRLDDELERSVARARRSGEPLSAVLIDLDRFKQINDQHGHQIGDRVIIETVQRLGESIREGDLLGRWGGDEFLLLASDADEAAAAELAERCRRTIAEKVISDVGHVTISLGVATLKRDEEPSRLLWRADRALCTAKAQGRNRVIGRSDTARTSIR